MIVTKGERANELSKCIDSLKNQTLKDFEIVIVIPKDTQYKNPNGIYRVVEQDAMGICNARNCGIQASKGEIIAFTDDDAEPYPDWVEKIDTYFKLYPDLSYLGGDFTLEVKNVWQRWVDHNYHLSENDVDRGLCHGNNMAYRREVFDNHRFDEKIIFGVDEAEFQMRLHKSGLKCANFSDMLIRHQHRSNFFSFTRMRWNYAQGHVYLYEEKFQQSLFHWDDLFNIALFISLFYTLLFCLVSPIIIIIPLAILTLIFLHEKRSHYTVGTLIIQVYATILWTLAKIYYSFKYHLIRWKVIT